MSSKSVYLIKRSVLLFACFFCVCGKVQAQPLDWADNVLAGHFDNMSKWWKYCYNDNTDKKIDSLRNAGGRIYDFIETIITRYPESLTASLPNSRAKGLYYVSAEDGRVRIFSWQAKIEGHGRPRYELRDIAGYVAGKGRKYRDISGGTEGGICTGVTAVHTKAYPTVYLANYYAMIDGEKLESIKAYTIVNDVFKEISVFQDGEKSPRQLWCQYNITLADLRTKPAAIHFSADKTKIYVPIIVKKGDQYVPGDKNLVYVFNGNLFVLDKNAQ